MIEDLLTFIGLEDLQPKGVEIGARCPMHERRVGVREQHPRHFYINRRTGVFHCFSCEYAGSIIKLIVDLTKLGLWEAHQLMRSYDVELENDDDRVWEPPVPSSDLETRLAGFTIPPDRAVRRRRLQRDSIDRFGVCWDTEEAAWICPIYGPSGDLWGWQAKTAEWVRNRPPGIRKSLTLFGLQAIQYNPQVVLVESPLDAVYLDGLGYAAVASFGAGVSDNQMRLIIERFDELVLALDNDKAGKAETSRLLGEHWHHRIPTQVFNYGYVIKGKDPGELSPSQIEMGIEDAVLAAFW